MKIKIKKKMRLMAVFKITSPLFVSLVFVLFATSCGYYRGSIENLDDPNAANNTGTPSLVPPNDSNSNPTNKILNNLSMSEFVSGSTQYVETPVRKYKVLASVGKYNSEIKTKTARGYTVYFSSQGAMSASNPTNP